MAVIFHDGFDIYNNATASTYDLINLSMVYGVTNNWYGFVTIVTGYDGIGSALSFSNSSSSAKLIQLPIETTLTSFSISSHIYLTHGSSGNVDIFTIENSMSGNHIRLTTTFSNPNTLNLVVNGQSNILTFVSTLDQNTWQHIELQGTITGTNQITVNFYIGGSLAASWTGAGFSTTPYEWDRMYIGKRNGSGNGSYLIDNLVVTDGEQTGIVEIKTIIPSADTAQNDGIPITGSENYSLLNDYTMNMDDRFVAFTSENLHDSYQMEDLSILDADYNIDSVQAISIMSQSSTMDTFNGYVSVDSSGVESGTIPVQLEQGNFSSVKSEILTNNPATSTPWTVSDVNNLNINVGRSAD